MKTPLIMLGAGGHASVLIDLALRLGHTILGVCAPQVTTLIGFPEIPYLGNDDVITKYSTHEVRLINGIGAISVQKNKIRSQLFEHYKLLGYTFETLVHPSAIVASAVQLDEGVQVMAGAIIQSNVAIGKNAIVNTGACIDHDCRIAHSVHVAPRVVLSGNVIIGGIL